MKKIIELHQVDKSYDKKKVLEKVSLSINEGSFTTLIGCNGAGKSTTLRIMAGVDNSTNGEVKVFEQNPFSFEFKERSDIFFIHESLELDSEFNLITFIKAYREVFPKWKNDVFNKILKDRKISLKKTFSDLSRGQKMQFMLMVGLAANPKVMLLDEITSVIDIEGQKYFLDALKDYVSRGGTVVITTNILSELNDYTDHLILLQETKLMVDGNVRNLEKKFLVLKKTEEHAIFSHKKIAKIRKDHDGKELYLLPFEVADQDSQVLKFKQDYTPKLEDILTLYFHLKQDNYEEELVG